MNKKKNKQKKVLKDWEIMTFQILKGITNIPGPIPGPQGHVTLYRKFQDASYITNDYVVGNVVVWLGFSSTSINEHSYYGPALCEIVLKQPDLGAVVWKYSVYQNESEVLLPPFTAFKVLEVARDVKRGSGHYAKYVKVECVGITQKIAQLVVPQKEKKMKKVEQAVLALNALETFNDKNLATILKEPMKKLAEILKQQKKELALFGVK